MIKYKLTMIDDGIQEGARLNRNETQICVIGWFPDEKKLAQWAESNDGELERVNEGDDE